MTVKLLTGQHLEFLSLKGSYTGLSESTLVKMSHCWKSHVTAQISLEKCFSRKVSVSVYWLPPLLDVNLHVLYSLFLKGVI